MCNNVNNLFFSAYSILHTVFSRLIQGTSHISSLLIFFRQKNISLQIYPYILFINPQFLTPFFWLVFTWASWIMFAGAWWEILPESFCVQSLWVKPWIGTDDLLLILSVIALRPEHPVSVSAKPVYISISSAHGLQSLYGLFLFWTFRLAQAAVTNTSPLKRVSL